MNILFVVSGGDAPGINATLYHSAVLAARYGWSLFGAQGGFPGVLAGNMMPLTAQALLPLVQLPGSLLASSRDPVLAQADAQTKMQHILTEHHIDALIVFGGDGTLRHIPPLLGQWGVAGIALPTTIDNDVPGTELTLGFDSACNFAYHAIDGIRATGHALTGRIFTLETLGGNTGFLALEIARGAGADVVLLPEIAYEPAWIMARLQAAIAQQGQALLVYSEGLPGKDDLLAMIPQQTGIRIRATHLGHAQRGGIPSHRDRAFAAEISALAFAALRENQNGIVVVRDGRVRLHQGTLANEPRKFPDESLYRQINQLS